MQAQTHLFEKILTQDGEANLSVRHIMQDDSGFLWLATFSGLYRYEGGDYIIKHEFNREGKINNDVTALIQDEQQNIWIGTNDGLSKYNPETEEIQTYFSYENDTFSISDDRIRSLDMDKDGRVWVGTKKGGLNLYLPEKDRFVRIKIDVSNGDAPLFIKSILATSDGRIWIGTWSQGLYCLSLSGASAKVVSHYYCGDSEIRLSHNSVYCLYEDTDGTIVAGTRNGLNTIDPLSGELKTYYTSYPFVSEKTTNTFRSILRDSNDKLWIGTWGGLLLCDSFEDLASGKFQLLQHNRDIIYSISHNQIMDVYQDRSGTTWIATENGLNRYDPYFNLFRPIYSDVINKLSEQTVTDYFPYDTSVLMLTLSDGILIANGNTYKPFYQNEMQEFLNEKFYTLFVDSKQNVWAGSRNGLLVNIDKRTNRVSSYMHSSENIPIYSIVELADNILAIGTHGEGLKYFNTRTRKFQPDRGLSADIQINNILVDKKKQIWVVTQLGIFNKGFHSEAFEYFLPDNADSILNPNIFIDIAESANGDIYVGGRNGLYVYNETTKSFQKKSFKNEQELWVTNLQFDSKDNLWMNLNFNQVAKWDPSTDLLKTFIVNNGTRSSSYNRRGFYIDNSDHVLLSGFDQIFEFDPASPIHNKYSPNPVFTKLRINNTDVHPGVLLNKQKILNKSISYTDEIKLNYLNTDFTIAFASSSYLNSSGNQFKYMLHGYDDEWHIGTEQSIAYSNLRVGRYTFEVFSANNDNIWSDDSARLDIRILPNPLLSGIAIILYILAFVVTFYFTQRAIVTRIRLRRELLIEKVKRDKEENFHQERLRFYTNISHELRTPLTLIMGPVKELINRDEKGTENAKLHQLILNNSQRLLSLVNQLLDFRKSLHHGMQLKVTKLNIIDVAESNIEAFAYMAKEKHINVQSKFPDQEINGWFDHEKLDIILFNILSNAFKYTPELGSVALEINTLESLEKGEATSVEIVVSNSGKGIPKHLKEKVFQRFYKIDEGKKLANVNTGIGIGLALVKNIVELHHGSILLESIPGKLTTFTITLPMKKENYSEDEVFDFTRDADRRTKEMIKAVEGQRVDSVFKKQDVKRRRLLIIEDNFELRDYLTAFLSADYKVYTATNGVEGLERCKEKHPELVVSDVMMAKMDGMEFCKILKSTPEISHIPVILMTALATVENKLEGYKVGADDYITKPFEPELLKMRVGNILDHLDQMKSEFKLNDKVTTKELTISRIDEEFLNKVIDLVDENLDNADFNIDNFCKNLGVSSSQLYRKIKGVAGVSPNEFIRTYRLIEAAQMITETNLSMSEISYKVGFNDPRYFSKCFKKQFGVVPTKYVQ